MKEHLDCIGQSKGQTWRGYGRRHTCKKINGGKVRIGSLLHIKKCQLAFQYVRHISFIPLQPYR